MFKWFEDLPLEDAYQQDHGRQHGSGRFSVKPEAEQILEDLMKPASIDSNEKNQRCRAHAMGVDWFGNRPTT